MARKYISIGKILLQPDCGVLWETIRDETIFGLYRIVGFKDSQEFKDNKNK